MFSDRNSSLKAYIATYQDLGFVKDNRLTIISPVKKVKQYSLELEKVILLRNLSCIIMKSY